MQEYFKIVILLGLGTKIMPYVILTLHFNFKSFILTMNNLLLTSGIYYLFVPPPPPQTPVYHPTVVPKIINIFKIYNETSN
jgi:hypothetical protein